MVSPKSEALHLLVRAMPLPLGRIQAASRGAAAWALATSPWSAAAGLTAADACWLLVQRRALAGAARKGAKGGKGVQKSAQKGAQKGGQDGSKVKGGGAAASKGRNAPPPPEKLGFLQAIRDEKLKADGARLRAQAERLAQREVKQAQDAERRRAGSVEAGTVGAVQEALAWWNGEPGRAVVMPGLPSLGASEAEDVMKWVRRELGGLMRSRGLAFAPPGRVPRLVALHESDLASTTGRLADLESALLSLTEDEGWGGVVEVVLPTFLDGQGVGPHAHLPYFSIEAFNRRHQAKLANLLSSLKSDAGTGSTLGGELPLRARLRDELEYWAAHRDIFNPSNVALLLRIFAVVDRATLIRMLDYSDDDVQQKSYGQRGGVQERRGRGARELFGAFWGNCASQLLASGRAKLPDAAAASAPVEPGDMLSLVTSATSLSEGEGVGLAVLPRASVLAMAESSAPSATKLVQRRFREGTVDLQAMVDLARAYTALGVDIRDEALAKMRDLLVDSLLPTTTATTTTNYPGKKTQGPPSDEDVALSFWIARSRERSVFGGGLRLAVGAATEKQDWEVMIPAAMALERHADTMSLRTFSIAARNLAVARRRWPGLFDVLASEALHRGIQGSSEADLAYLCHLADACAHLRHGAAGPAREGLLPSPPSPPPLDSHSALESPSLALPLGGGEFEKGSRIPDPSPVASVGGAGEAEDAAPGQFLDALQDELASRADSLKPGLLIHGLCAGVVAGRPHPRLLAAMGLNSTGGPTPKVQVQGLPLASWEGSSVLPGLHVVLAWLRAFELDAQGSLLPPSPEALFRLGEAAYVDEVERHPNRLDVPSEMLAVVRQLSADGTSLFKEGELAAAEPLALHRCAKTGIFVDLAFLPVGGGGGGESPPAPPAPVAIMVVDRGRQLYDGPPGAQSTTLLNGLASLEVRVLRAAGWRVVPILVREWAQAKGRRTGSFARRQRGRLLRARLDDDAMGTRICRWDPSVPYWTSPAFLASGEGGRRWTAAGDTRIYLNPSPPQPPPRLSAASGPQDLRAASDPQILQ